MSRALNDLAPAFRPLAVELLARCVEAGYPVIIVDTLRTPAEQADCLARGVSWTTHSKHLDGKAIDIAPYEHYVLHGENKIDWDASDPIWLKLGAIGEALGLKWGGRFKLPAKPDPGHFELIEAAAPAPVRA